MPTEGNEHWALPAVGRQALLTGKDPRSLRQVDTLTDGADESDHQHRPQAHVQCILCARYFHASHVTFMSMIFEPYAAMVNATHNAAKVEYHADTMWGPVDDCYRACDSRACAANAANRALTLHESLTSMSTNILKHIANDYEDARKFVGGHYGQGKR